MIEFTTAAKPGTREDIRPFTIAVPEEQLDDLRKRIIATSGPIEKPMLLKVCSLRARREIAWTSSR